MCRQRCAQCELLVCWLIHTAPRGHPPPPALGMSCRPLVSLHQHTASAADSRAGCLRTGGQSLGLYHRTDRRDLCSHPPSSTHTAREASCCASSTHAPNSQAPQTNTQLCSTARCLAALQRDETTPTTDPTLGSYWAWSNDCLPKPEARASNVNISTVNSFKQSRHILKPRLKLIFLRPLPKMSACCFLTSSSSFFLLQHT